MKNTTTTRYIVIMVILIILTYLCFAFIILDFNPLNWNLDNRTAFVFSLVSIIVLGLPIYGFFKGIED